MPPYFCTKFKGISVRGPLSVGLWLRVLFCNRFGGWLATCQRQAAWFTWRYLTFLYAIGQRVRWRHDPRDHWIIVARHYREGPEDADSVGYGAVRYGLVCYDAEQRLQSLQAAEAALEAVEGEGTRLLR